MHSEVVLGGQKLLLPPTGKSNVARIYKFLEVVDNFKKTNPVEYQFIPDDPPIRLINNTTTPESKEKMADLFLKIRDYSEKNLKDLKWI